MLTHTKGYVRPGDTFEVTLAFEEGTLIKSVGIDDIEFDSNTFELNTVEWLLEDTVIADWDSSNNIGVAVFENNTSVTDLVRLTLTVKDSAPEGIANIGCTIVLKQKDTIEVTVPVYVEEDKVPVRYTLPGDTNGDNTVTDADAVLLLYYTLFPEKYTVNQECDFNGDKVVDSDDAVYLLYYTLYADKYPLNY